MRHLYGFDLRRHREHADLSLAKLAGEVPCSKSQLARIETAESMALPGLSEEFDRLFGTNGHFVRLHALVRRELHPDQYRRFMGYEENAQVIEYYATQAVPGLLQTKEYARAFFGYAPDVAPEVLEERLAARMLRQERLEGAGSLRVWAILDEAVLRRPVGGPRIMRGQLARLLLLGDDSASALQVLPFAHGGHALMEGPLTLLRMRDGRAVAWEEGRNSGYLHEDAELVERRRRLYDALRAYALSPKESAQLIRRIMEEYKPS
ncbi:DUF5753 domain-containing protein [Streptomyces johnsoniae]|uniref:DUF5753 domain-containing protein n=1 Tax=Streptomyces johnsoniae TaxID=3075532 RepID=A0ABU2SC98_9ACTN|nr:DUF5753 domain-containing protein [Streptomyces sp. DSM 41886]MDT0446603.1 DUF5753 domain-containing protein [Streptomyces sp. DSM 41886]